MVQNLIERCLQLYLTKEEVVSVLREQATIDPEFTQLIWSKLEEQNPDFFRCYYTRLKLKAQIVMFNHLLEQQVSVVQKMQQGWLGNNGSATASGIPLFQGGTGETGGDDMAYNNRQISSRRNVFEDARGRRAGERIGTSPDPSMYLYSAENGGPSPYGYNAEFDLGGSGLLANPNTADGKNDGIRRNFSLSDFDIEGEIPDTLDASHSGLNIAEENEDTKPKK